MKKKYVELDDVLDVLDDVCRKHCPHPPYMRLEHCDKCLLNAAMDAVEQMEGGKDDGSNRQTGGD